MESIPPTAGKEQGRCSHPAPSPNVCPPRSEGGGGGGAVLQGWGCTCGPPVRVRRAASSPGGKEPRSRESGWDVRPGAARPGRGCDAPDAGPAPAPPDGEFLQRSAAQNLLRSRTPFTPCGAVDRFTDALGRGWPCWSSLGWVDRKIRDSGCFPPGGTCSGPPPGVTRTTHGPRVLRAGRMRASVQDCPRPGVHSPWGVSTQANLREAVWISFPNFTATVPSYLSSALFPGDPRDAGLPEPLICHCHTRPMPKHRGPGPGLRLYDRVTTRAGSRRLHCDAPCATVKIPSPGSLSQVPWFEQQSIRASTDDPILQVGLSGQSSAAQGSKGEAVQPVSPRDPVPGRSGRAERTHSPHWGLPGGRHPGQATAQPRWRSY